MTMFAIDCHAHIYMKKMASKAVKGVGEFYDVPMSCTGISEELHEIAVSSPVRHFVVNVVAPSAKHVHRLNVFAAEECAAHSEFTGLATLHPDMENPDEEIEAILALGLKGIKLHPDTQHFDADSDKAMRLYECIAGRLPLLIHCGDYRYDSSHPRRIARIIEAFPELTVVAAHFGGWSIYDEAIPYLTDKNCYMDISSAMPFLPPEKIHSLIRHYGAERLMFGSDYPMWDPVREYEAFMKLDLTEQERELILRKNAAKVFSIDVSALG